MTMLFGDDYDDEPHGGDYEPPLWQAGGWTQEEEKRYLDKKMQEEKEKDRGI